MNIQTFQDHVSRHTRRMLGLLLDIVSQETGSPAPGGLPAGALHLGPAKLIIAGTPCDAPVFHGAMRAAAAATGADVVLVHHGLFPETMSQVTFSVLVHMSGQPYLLENMVLYHHPEDGYWLVPSSLGPYVALEQKGLRVDFQPPFVTFVERMDGVCAAAAKVVRATRFVGAY
jgi:hypothetical protein